MIAVAVLASLYANPSPRCLRTLEVCSRHHPGQHRHLLGRGGMGATWPLDWSRYRVAGFLWASRVGGDDDSKTAAGDA